MSMAIKYRMMKKHKMAKGGEAEMHETPDQELISGMKKAFHKPMAEGGTCHACGGKIMAHGGFVEEEEASGFEPEDMTSRIMRKRKKSDSSGELESVKDANDSPPVADFEENEFDDLVKDDSLDEHYTGKNSGDELGDEAVEEEDKDLVSKIMKSRKKKDRMPRPA